MKAQKMLIFLTGFMGCGKTTVGRQLSEQLGIRFLDSDAVIVAQSGRSVREIFETKGEGAFRELERRFVAQLDSNNHAVVSLGGGLPCYNNLMESLKRLGTVIYLKTQVDTLVERLESEKAQRPLLEQEGDLSYYVGQKLKEREPIYQQAHFCVPTDQQSIEAITMACAALIQ